MYLVEQGSFVKIFPLLLH